MIMTFNFNLTKTPTECVNKDDIREQIDLIDQQIIRLFAQRFQYVKEIVKFKRDAESVVAQDRKNHVIQQRGEWAEANGLDNETFQQIYRLLVDHNISKEMEILNCKQLNP
jgi:chorismate mutase